MNLSRILGTLHYGLLCFVAIVYCAVNLPTSFIAVVGVVIFMLFTSVALIGCILILADCLRGKDGTS